MIQPGFFDLQDRLYKIDKNGDPLDICVLSERAIARNEIIVRCRVIGGLQMIDRGEADDKIISVLENDHVWGAARDLADVPDVLVERIVVEDRPARAILTAAAGAQLIVVGSRGRGGAVDPAIGSVAQAVLHGAPCPLLIVRPESEPHG